jgi:hypothetical protein
MGQKRTWRSQIVMSALPRKRTLDRAGNHIGFYPFPTEIPTRCATMILATLVVTCCDGGPALPRSAYCTTHRLQRVVYRFTSGMSAGGLGISSPNTLGVGSEFAWLACVAPRPR